MFARLHWKFNEARVKPRRSRDYRNKGRTRARTLRKISSLACGLYLRWNLQKSREWIRFARVRLSIHKALKPGRRCKSERSESDRATTVVKICSLVESGLNLYRSS
jgi:hypothetical protein